MTIPAPFIAVMAFDRDIAGDLVPAFDPKPMPDDLHAKVFALDIRRHHDGVIAFRRGADLAAGDQTEILTVYGDVPDLK